MISNISNKKCLGKKIIDSLRTLTLLSVLLFCVPASAQLNFRQQSNYVLTTGDTMTGKLFLPSIRVTGLVNCDTIDTNSSGDLACGNDSSGSGGGTNLVTQVNGITQSTTTGTMDFQTTNTWIKIAEPTPNTFVISTKNTFPGNLSLLGLTTGTFAANSASTGALAAANDDDNSLATTSYVQQEINGAAGTGITVSSGVISATLGTSIDISSETNLVDGDALTMAGDTINFDGGTAPGGSLGGTWASPTIDDLFVLNTGDTITGASPGQGYLYITQTLAVGQNSIATSAILELSSSTKALLLTRVTEPSTSITTPVDGMIAYDTDNDQLEARISGAWVDLRAASTALALAADPANCASSGFAGGVTAAGVAESCTTPGSGVATWITTPSSANLASAVTGETGSGALVFGTAPTISAATLTGTMSVTGTLNVTSGDLILPNNTICTTLNPNPTNGQICVDTNATSGQQVYVAESGTWVLQGDGGGSEVNNLETITTGIQTTEIPVGTAANTVVYAALSGDVTMTNGGVVTVVDNSHAHTTTTLSGIDIGDDTNLVAGTNITLVGDTLNVDDSFLLNTTDTGAGPYTITGSMTIQKTLDVVGTLQLGDGASVTTDVFGEVAADNNAWASGRGAMQFYDGTANVFVPGVLASDTPSDGQVPKFNTGGTITWEADNNSGGGGGSSPWTFSGANNLVYIGTITTAVAIGNTTPETSVMLDISSTTKALLITRMTEPSTNIQSPLDGMIAYDTNNDEVEARIGGSWKVLATTNIGSINIIPGSMFISGTVAIVGDATQGAQIDGSNASVLLFDATTDEGAAARFQLPSDWVSHNSLRLTYSMASGTANEVDWEAADMCQTPGDSERDDADGFAAIASTSDTVPGTVFFPDVVSITLTDDSCAAGDVATIFISTDSDDATLDDATGDRRLISAIYFYNRS